MNPKQTTTKHMMTSSNGNIFRVTGPLCGEFTGPVEFPTQRPVTRSFDVFFDLRLNKRLSKQPWGWWSETLSSSLWRHCNDNIALAMYIFHGLCCLSWLIKRGRYRYDRGGVMLCKIISVLTDYRKHCAIWFRQIIGLFTYSAVIWSVNPIKIYAIWIQLFAFDDLRATFPMI